MKFHVKLDHERLLPLALSFSLHFRSDVSLIIIKKCTDKGQTGVYGHPWRWMILSSARLGVFVPLSIWS